MLYECNMLLLQYIIDKYVLCTCINEKVLTSNN